MQSLSAGVVRIAHDGMGAAANALSAIGESISGRLGSFGGMFMNGLGWFINLLSIDPPEGDDEDPEDPPADPHDLNEVFWNPSPEDKIGPDGTVLLLKGDDANSGEDDLHPVLTWERAMSLVAPGGVIWVMTMETVLYSEALPVTVRDGGVVDEDDALQVTELKYYPGNSFLLASAIEETISPIGASLTLKNLKMIDLTVDDDPEDQNRLLNLNGGTVTLDSGMEMRGDVRIEMFSDETDATSSPEIYITEDFMNDFDANVDLTVHFDTRLSDHHTNSGDRIAFDFLVFPEGFDVEPDDGTYSILDNVHLDPVLQEPRGEDNLIWNVRKKIGADNIVEIFLVEPYDGCVYVSGEGNDAWEGLYAWRPVRTFARALEILMGNGGDLSYAAFISENVSTINEYRAMHGEFVPTEGLIRICGAPVGVADEQTWSMPQETYWDRGPTGKKLDDNGNPYPRVDHAWVERYKHYLGDLIEVMPGGDLTFTDITVKGMKSTVKSSGSILLVQTDGLATLQADSLLTDNKAVEGGGARLEGPNAELVMNGGKITNNLATRNGNTGYGGGVYVYGGILTMNSGEITDNKADLGGGIYAGRYEKFIEDPLVIVSVGRIYLYGESVVTRNTAREGAGVFLSYSDTVLLPNDATAEQIAAYHNGTDRFSGVCCISVTGNTASYYGGGWGVEDCTLTVDGAEVTGNNVTLNNVSGAGGGIALRRGYLKMINGASVHDNFVKVATSSSTAVTAQGGGVYSTTAPAPVVRNGVIEKYSLEMDETSSIHDNYIDGTSSTSKGRNLYGGGLAIGSSAGGTIRIDGEIYGNYMKMVTYSEQYSRGAGMTVYGVHTYLEEHCKIHDNYIAGMGYAYGIGVDSRNGGSLYLNKCEIYNNNRKLINGHTWNYPYRSYGGGIFKSGGALNFNGCKIHDNIIQDEPYTRDYQGGGAFLENVASVNIEPKTEIYNHTGYNQGGGIYINNTDTSNPVTEFTSTETANEDDYAEIRNNVGKEYDYYGCGGGIYVYGAKKIDLKCLKITNNTAGYAGGMYVQYNRQADFDRCIFKGNRAEDSRYGDNSSDDELAVKASGGALFFYESGSSGKNTDLNFRNCKFYANYARDKGGAVYLYHDNGGYYYDTTSSYFHYFRPVFDSCIFGDGTAANANKCSADNGRGGAIFIRGGEVTITGASVFDCNTASRGGAIWVGNKNYPNKVWVKITATDSDIVFRNNSAAYQGGAIRHTLSPLIIHGGEHRVIFENNTANDAGGAIWAYQGEVRLDHCDFINNAMQWVEPVVGMFEEGYWEPTACKGRSLYSHQAYIYLDASSVTADEFYLYNFGRQPIDPRSNIRLTGAPNAAFGVLKVNLNITANTYYRDGDIVVEYTSSVPDCTPYLDYFELVGDAALVYNLTPVSKNLVLAPKSVYIDGIDGDDSNPGDLPTRAVKTFAAAREKLVELLEFNPGGEKKIYIVNTVTILPQTDDGGEPILDGEGNPVPEVWTFDGYTMPHLDDNGERDGTYEPITGVLMQAYIADSRLNYPSKALIDVKGGSLVFDDITLDGNRSAKPSQGANYGIKVYEGGSLSVIDGAVIQNHRDAIYAYGSGTYGNVTLEILDSTIKNCNQGTGTSANYASGSDSTRDNASSGLTIKSGNLTMDNVEISGCYGYKRGGGMYLYNTVGDISNLHLFNCNLDQSLSSSNSYDDVYSGYSYHYYPNRQDGYRGRGGGAYLESCNITMTDSVFEKCGSSQTKAITGMALAVRGGTLVATNVLFNENGKQDIKNGSGYLDYNAYSYGVLHVGSSANVTLNLCTFTKCYGYYGGAIRLDIGSISNHSVYNNNNYMGVLYEGFNAPTLHLNGCTFGGNTDNACYSYFGGSVIWSQGFDYWLRKDGHNYHDACYPQIYIDEYVHEVDGETVHTPTVIQSNVSRQYYGAIYALYSDVHIANSNLLGNCVYYPYSTFQSRPSGGAAVYTHGGSLTLENSLTKSNYSQNRDGTNTGGAIFVSGQDANQMDASLTVKNSEIANNQITCTDGGKTLRGAGIDARFTSSVLLEDTVVSGNSFTANGSHNYGRYAFNAKGAGIAIEYSNSAILRRVTSRNNKANAVKSNRTYTHGAALLCYRAKVLLDDFTSTNDVSTEGIAVSLSSCHYIGFKNGISVEDDIHLGENDLTSPYSPDKPTPIQLLNAITGEGELKLRFDEYYSGRHIVCGYTEDESESVYDDNHQPLGLNAAFAAELGTVGELDAWEYLNESAAPRFVAAQDSAARNMMLVPGNAYEEYAHDIIVANLMDVYLDGQTGVDPTLDEEGNIINFNTDSSGLLHDGRSPKTAVKTFAAAKKVLESGISGGNIIVCGQVNITGEETWTLGDVTNTLGNTWHASVVRYYNPEQISAARYAGYLIDVQPGGTLVLDDVEIDGQFDRNDIARVYNSLIRVSGGEMVLCGGTLLENNNSDYGGAISVTAAGSLVEMYDATIYRCTADMNSICGVQHAWGGALYITGGEFRMMDADSVIRSCGAYYTSNDSSRYDRCWGGAVYVNGGIFRMLNGKITDTQVWRSDRNYNYGYMYIHGTVFEEGPRYNAETGEGSLAEIGGEVSYNYLNVNGSRWRYEQNYTTSYPIPIYGSALSMYRGLMYLTGEQTVTLEDSVLGTTQVSSPGGNIVGNRTRGGVSYGMVYIKGDRSDMANTSLLRMTGGVIDGWHDIDSTYSTYSYLMYITDAGGFEMSDGKIYLDYCYYG
ncbi:MAG: hypothetical protein IJR51_00005, partial [Clostridia bacterium]|nr:hypothetical protein [Clostridia bacterium]